MRHLPRKFLDGGWVVRPTISPHRANLQDGLIKGISSTENAYSTQPHSHDCDTIFVPIAGHFGIEQEAAEPLQARPGYFLWMPADYVHATTSYTINQRHLVLYVDSDYWNEAARSNGVKNHEIGLRYASTALSYYASEIANSKQGALSFSLTAQFGALVQEAARLSASKPIASTSLTSTECALLFADYIKSHLGEPLEVDTFAAGQRISRRHLERSFSEYFGMGPLAYQQQSRLEQVIRLLMDTDLSVLAIAHEVGWSSGSYLARMVSKSYGVSPSDIRAKYRLAHAPDGKR